MKKKQGNGYVTYNPKIGPEPAIRELYRGYSQYDITLNSKVYTITFNENNLARFAAPMLQGYVGWTLRKFLRRCEKKDISYKKVADEKEGIWNL